MPRAIVCSTPAYGHVRPMLGVASTLLRRGWRVRFVTGMPFADAVAATGAEFVPLTPEYDAVLTPPPNGRASLNHARKVFFDAVPAQVRLLRRMLAEEPADAVVTELAFMGGRALLGDPPATRPVFVNCCVFPLVIGGRGIAPFGAALPPATTAAQRSRYRLLTAFMHHIALRPIHRSGERLYSQIGAPGLGGRSFMDIAADADLLAEFSVPAFEYPRTDAPASLRFYGRPTATLPSLAPLPEWWDRLDDRPIVHVTQGTAFNDDYELLVGPTLRALADRPVQVILATGGRPLAELPPLPPNAFAARYLPYDRLLERTAVLVTNGGFGTVTEALAHGVPIVIGSGFGDQVETAARVAWSGVGIDVGKHVPSERRIAEAVDRVLTDPFYRAAASRIAGEFDAATGADGLVESIEELCATRAAPVSDDLPTSPLD
jgi:UDP:flavonoid glycosyltransferase YjiC (YdhE family)